MSNNKKYIFLLSFLAVIIVASFLRFYKLYGFATYLGDQGRDAIIVKRIVTLEHFPAIGAPSSVGQVYLGPFYYYLIAPFLPLFNFNPIGLAFGVAFLSIIGTILAMYIVSRMFGRKITILFGILIALCYVLVDLARFSWNPNLLPFFSFFSFYFFYKWIKEPALIWGILTGAFLSFSLQLHYLSFFIFIPVAIVYFNELINSKSIMRYILMTIPMLLAFGLFTSPLIIFDLRHGFINMNNFIKLFTDGQVASSSSYSYRLGETIQSFINNSFQIHVSMMIGVEIFAGLMLLFAIITFSNNSSFLFLHFLNVIVYMVGFAFLSSARHAHYFGPTYMSFFLLLSCILLLIGNKYFQYILIACFIILFAYLNIPKYYFLFYQPNDQIEHSKKVGEFLLSQVGDKPFNIGTWPVQFTEDPYTYFMELKGKVPSDRAKIEITDQMFVICEKKPCPVIDSPSWNISMFGKAKIVNEWQVEKLYIYKLVHL